MSAHDWVLYEAQARAHTFASIANMEPDAIEARVAAAIKRDNDRYQRDEQTYEFRMVDGRLTQTLKGAA